MSILLCFVKYIQSYRTRISNTQLRHCLAIKNKFSIIPQFLIQVKTNGTLVEKDVKISTCGTLCLADVGTRVMLRGFLQYQRKGMFCVLRDAFGITQIIINNNEKLTSTLKEAPYESYMEVIGDVIRRPEGQINTAMKTGEIEVDAQELHIVNKSKKDMPFLIRNHNMPTETLALKYRYLDLRHHHMQENLRFRSKVGKKMRDYLQDVEDFIEITTPTLSVNTPGGAQEFLVPSQFKGEFYSLTQSPQIYKQLAVIGGFEKYFQFAICFRDEGGKLDRQPEFMQLDLEMSNATFPIIQNLLESLILHSWPKELPSLEIPFPLITYTEALECYGTDKPDIRFLFKISDVTSIFSEDDLNRQGYLIVAKAFVFTGGGEFLKGSHKKKWLDIAKREVGLSEVNLLEVQKGNRVKRLTGTAFSDKLSQQLVCNLEVKEGDVIVMSIGHKSKVLKLLGRLRLAAADILENNGIFLRDKNNFKFLWVTDFPLFEMDESTEKLQPCHHPFTAPKIDHVQKLYNNPLEVQSQHYDLVLNGCEIAGGSVRIHDSKLQRDIFNILNIDSAKFEFLLEALSSGAPPHGGIALGFDRYISILRGCESIREVMAFPKSSEGRCLMLKSPEKITKSLRELYHI